MKNGLEWLMRAIIALGPDRRGSTATIFGFSSIVIMGFTGYALDYANLELQKRNLQGVADRTALAAVRELRLASNTNATVLQDAKNIALAHAGATPITSTGAISTDRTTLTINLTQVVATYMMQYAVPGPVQISAVATAKLVGGSPICLVGLETNANFTVALEKSAAVQASGCAVYSNSTKPNGLSAKNGAILTAAFICSAGGKAGGGPGSFSPTPQTNCPTFPDPLAGRPGPMVGPCAYTNLTFSSGSHALTPGTYCGGLTLTGGATATLGPGAYVMLNGPLYVTGGATLNGAGVGFYFSGPGAILNLDAASSVTLTAPTAGEMAGMLVFEDRASPAGQSHQILSNNAHTLLGTIYIPQGLLTVGANAPVADTSDFTIIVARQFFATAGPTLVLNSNYASSVPVPAGLGPNGATTVLSQ